MINGSKLLRFLNSPQKMFRRTICPPKKGYTKDFMIYLKNLPEMEVTQLPNGLTVATESRECLNTTVGLFVDAGSRYESQYNNGIAHFFEHIAYTGTCARTKEAIQNQMSCSGARFRCFTTRELVCYYAECLCEDVALITDLLSDCVFNNCLDACEIEFQKNIVYTEMLQRDRDLNVLLYDYLHASAFQGTPLAQSVVGPSNNLYNFCSASIQRYLEKFFHPPRTVLAAVGGITHRQMVDYACCYLSKLETSKCLDIDTYRYSGSSIVYRNDAAPMANAAIAVEGPCFCDDDSYVMNIARMLVGGWDRTQYGGLDHANVPAQASIEHRCVAYRSFNITYKDCGLWGVHFMAPTINLDDVVSTFTDSWMKLCTVATDNEVERAKKQLKTKVLTKMDSCSGTCLDMGRWMLYHGHRPSLYDRIVAIDLITADILKKTCSHYLYCKSPVVVAVGPTEGLPDYNRIESGMYWLRY